MFSKKHWNWNARAVVLVIMLIVSAGFTVVHTSTALATDTEPIAAPSTTKSESSIQLSDYTARYTGKAVAYGGDIERTGSTGAVTFRYYTDEACTTAVAATRVVKPHTYYVVATLAADADYKAVRSTPAKLIVTKATSTIQLSDYTAPYTGKAVAYGGEVERTGSTGAVVYSYFSDAACTEEVAASEVVNAGTYYVTASLLSDSNYEAATSAVAVMTIDADLTPVVNPEETTTYSSWDDVPANTYEKETLSFDFNGQTIYGVAYIPQLEMENYPLVICSHGINGNNTSSRDFASLLASHGIAAYCFDFRGGKNSQSDGNWEDTTIMTEVEDLQAIIAAAKQWDFVDPSKIILYGLSQGGIVSAITAARNVEDVNGLILLYPAFSIPYQSHMLFNSLDDVPDTYTIGKYQFGKAYFVDIWDYDVYGEIVNYTNPVLLMHGDKDVVVPIYYSNHASEVYSDVDYFVIKGAGHGFAGQNRVEADQHILDYLIKIGIL